MTRLPQITGERLIKALRRVGFVHKRWHGSHAILDNGQVTLSIPCHKARLLKKGLLGALLKDAGLTVEEFSKLL